MYAELSWCPQWRRMSHHQGHMSLTFAHLFLVLPGCFPVVLSLSETRMNLDLVWELPEKQ